jgi:NAD(P)-dependent dehydrogenase (short-subunit alcohol dehydrogenase family)
MADGQSVFITGATGAIGTALVASLSERGWRVLAAGRRSEAVERATFVALDLTSGASIGDAAEEARSLLGGQLDALVNLAGISADGPLELVSPDAMRRAFEVNVLGQLALTQQLLPLLRTATGRIVNVGGAAGQLTLPLYGALSASKAALDAVTDAMRMELAPQGVRVAYVEPGAVRTGFFARSAADAEGFHRPDPDLERRYGSAIAAAGEAVRTGRAIPVERVVHAIERALTARSPRARYKVGLDARLGVPLLTHLPAVIRDRILLRSLGVSAASLGAG